MKPRTLTHNGETLTIDEWCQRVGVSRPTLLYRINAGWPIAEALTKARDKRGPTPVTEAVSYERDRCERRHKAELARLQRQFIQLAQEIDRSLTAFNNRLVSLTEQDTTPGVGQLPSENANDRPTRVSQDCA